MSGEVLYNAALQERISAYEKQKKSISKYDQLNSLPDIKDNIYQELKDVNAQVLQNVIEKVDLAYKAFFRRLKTRKSRDEKPGFPRFKSRNRYKSFTLKQNGWKLVGNSLYISKVGKFHLKISTPILGDIKTITVKKASTGKWFISFSCDNVPPRVYPETNKAVGIDLGLTSFIHDTENKTVKHPKPCKTSLEVLREKSRALSKTKNKNTGKYKRAKKRLALEYEKEKNQRLDFSHKTSTDYVRNHKFIAAEDLDIQELVQKKGQSLARNINDSAWGTFLRLLSYKAEEAGRVFVKVDPRDTTQECCFCGTLVPKTLHDRVHACPVCGLVCHGT